MGTGAPDSPKGTEVALPTHCHGARASLAGPGDDWRDARSWKVTVENKSSEPATVFVAEEGEDGTLRLVGSASPNVVPAGATAKVTFLVPAKGGPDDGWIYVNPRPGEGGSLVNAADLRTSGKILITQEGTGGWLSP